MKAEDKTYRYKMWLTDIICNTGPEWKRLPISHFTAEKMHESATFQNCVVLE